MKKVIIAGSRDFEHYSLLEHFCNEFLDLCDSSDVEIVSGGARGADKLGEQYAKEKGYRLKIFPANWKEHGKSAGYIRNKQMAEYADACVCFWDGKSRGAKMMMDLAQEYKLTCLLIEYEDLLQTWKSQKQKPRC